MVWFQRLTFPSCLLFRRFVENIPWSGMLVRVLADWEVCAVFVIAHLRGYLYRLCSPPFSSHLCHHIRCLSKLTEIIWECPLYKDSLSLRSPDSSHQSSMTFRGMVVVVCTTKECYNEKYLGIGAGTDLLSSTGELPTCSSLRFIHDHTLCYEVTVC